MGGKANLRCAAGERTCEIGVIRSVGATRLQMRRKVVMEATILAALEAPFGYLSGL